MRVKFTSMRPPISKSVADFSSLELGEMRPLWPRGRREVSSAPPVLGEEPTLEIRPTFDLCRPYVIGKENVGWMFVGRTWAVRIHTAGWHWACPLFRLLLIGLRPFFLPLSQKKMLGWTWIRLRRRQMKQHHQLGRN
jgi:hypothetical protein